MLDLLSVLVVGVRRFELPTPCTPCRCATRLHYTPTEKNYNTVSYFFVDIKNVTV